MQFIRRLLFTLPNGFVNRLFINLISFLLLFVSIWYFDVFGLILNNDRVLIKYFYIFILLYSILITLLFGFLFIYGRNLPANEISSKYPFLLNFVYVLIFGIIFSIFLAFYHVLWLKSLIISVLLIVFTLAFFDFLAVWFQSQYYFFANKKQ